MQKVREIPWVRIGAESVAIVASILLAFAIDTWWEDRRDRQDEVLILQQIRTAIALDLADLKDGLNWATGNHERLTELLERLRGTDQLGTEIQPLFGAVSEWITVNTRRRMGPYEELKNDGFSLISDSSIRTQIIDVYEIQLVSAANEADAEFSLNQVIPYMHQHFEGYSDPGWAPVDGFDSLRDDVYFLNLVGSKQRRLERFIIPAFERAVAAVETLISELDEKLP